MSDVTVVVEDPSVTVRLDPNGVVAAYFAGLTNNRLIKTSSGAPADSLIAEGTITGALTVSKSGSTAREVTFPDADLTVAGTNVAQTYTAVQTYGTGLLVAADVKASGSGGGQLLANNNTVCLTWGAGGGSNLTAAGGLTVTGAIAVNDTTDASSTTTGSLQTDGGLGVVKSVFVGGAVDVVGNIKTAGDLNLNNGHRFRSVGAISARLQSTDASSCALQFANTSNTLLGTLTATASALTCSLPLTLSGSNALTVGGGITHGSATLLTTTTALTNGAGASAGTLTNAPSAGDPTKWIPIDDNGTTRYIPAW